MQDPFALASGWEHGRLVFMDNATQLQLNGIAPTDKRIEIFSLFRSSCSPLSATAILATLKEKKIHRATVFRSLKLLEEHGLVRRVDFMEGEYRYELTSLPHHHHAVCRTCGTIESVEVCAIDELKKNVEMQVGFKVMDHSFELFGVCKKCSELV